MNEAIVQALLGYLDEDDPKAVWLEQDFERASYSRWAAGELLTEIMDHPEMAAGDIIFAFAARMYAWQVLACERTEMFSIAADFACGFLES